MFRDVRDEFGGFGTEYLAQIYFKPWPHGSVFFIGLIFGYIIHEIRPKKLSKVNSLII
jgi:hypothetical protein